MQKNEIYICIDAGGTSCKAAIFSNKGEILARGYGKSGSPAISINDWYLHIDQSIIEALNNFKNDNSLNDFQIKKISLGVSGISALSNTNMEQKYFETKYQVPCSIASDTLTALYSVIDSKDEDGIVVISGTGIGIFGKNNKETFLIGGWGHLLREHGSAYSIVHDFVVNMINKFEAMIEFDDLEKTFLKRFRIVDIRDFNHMFYQHSKDEIASYSVFFKEMAKKNNQHAISLLKQEGQSLAIQVEKT